MNLRPKRRTFRFVEVDKFDARRGYRRSTPPGIEISGGDWPSAVADFWTNRDGKWVIRLSSLGYVFHLEAFRTDGRQLSTHDMDEFKECVLELLEEWVIEGVDDLPESIYDR